MTVPVPTPPANIQAELARERNRAAAERTLMAWIRTSLALISFGFGIDSIVSAIRSQGTSQGTATAADTANLDSVSSSRILGLAFVALGIYAMVVAAIEHYRELQRIQRDVNYLYRSRHSLGLTVAIALIGIGVVSFAAILIRAITSAHF